jgi:hypothetical protein
MNAYALLDASQAASPSMIDSRMLNMKSPSAPESLHSHTPAAIFDPVVKITQPNRGTEGWERNLLVPET